MNAEARPTTVEALKDRAWLLACMLVVMWGIEAVDAVFFDGGLDRFGIRPHEDFWLGVLFAPFLHAGFAHLGANSIPFLVLGGFTILRKTGDFLLATVAAILIGGLGVWLVGNKGEVHLGASGLIFGYLGFLVVRALFEHSLASLVFAILAALLYGGLIWGVVPGEQGVSWQGHLFGLVGGGIAGWLRASEYREDNPKRQPSEA